MRIDALVNSQKEFKLTALTNFLESDTIFISRLEFDLNGPEQIGPGHKIRSNICLNKQRGQLAFKLNTVKHLGIAQPFDFDIEFTGFPNGGVIDWTVDQSIDRDFDIAGSSVDVHVDSVKGAFRTAITARNPRTTGQDCAGVTRSVGVDLHTSGSENSIDIAASVLLTGITITAENISILADARDQFAIDARIKVLRNECGITSVSNGQMSVWAQVNNVPAGALVTYLWSVAGGTAVGPTNKSNLRIKLGANGAPVSISLMVTVEGVSLSLSHTHTPEDEEAIRIKRLRCRIAMLVRINRFADPLWDPLRDHVIRPLSHAELQRLGKFAASLQKEVLALSEMLKLERHAMK